MSDDTVPAGDAFDWAAIRGRLAALEAALDPDAEHSPERVRALLEERAARIAETVDAEDEDALEVLRFRHAGQVWAIGTRHVHAVMPLRAVTPLPAADAGIVGVAAWRGDPLVVRELSGARASDRAAQPFALVVGGERPAFALPVEALPEVVTLPRSHLHAAPAELAADRPWLTGVTDEAVFVIDGHELIAPVKREDEP